MVLTYCASITNCVFRHYAILPCFVFYHKTLYAALTVHSDYLHIFPAQNIR